MTFQEIYDLLLQEAKKKKKGTTFEYLVRGYLKKHPRYATSNIKAVYLWDEWEYRDKSVDCGIDLVVESTNHRDKKEYWAIQCKFLAKYTTINKNFIESFIVESSLIFSKDIFFSKRIFFTTSNKIGDNVHKIVSRQKKGEEIQFILYDDLNDGEIKWPKTLSKEEIENIQYKKHELRKYQIDAVNAVIKGFKTQNKGQLIMACGTGKTLVSLKIAETMRVKSVLFVLPSISLMSQTIEAWNADSAVRQRHLAVCSDETVKTEDSFANDMQDLRGISATTDTDEIRHFLNSQEAENTISVIFITYHSLILIEELQKNYDDISFDLAIADEAHRCTGIAGEMFTKLVEENVIHAKKKLFMTATPKIYSNNVKKTAKNRNIKLYTMDDTSKFGEKFYTYGFTRAIEDGYLTDYKVVVLGLKQESTLEGNKFNFSEQVTSNNFKALEKFFATENIHQAIAFSSTIKDSNDFKNKMNEYNGKFEIQHVDGKCSSLQRREGISWLKDKQENTFKILSNARCLSEGIDVPKINAVIFLSPKRSMIDIVQSVGRAIRKADNKKLGYIVIPIATNQEQDPKTQLEQSSFQSIWDVLTALRSHDETIASDIDALQFSKPSSKIEFVDLQSHGKEQVDLNKEQIELHHPELDFEKLLYAKILEKCGDRKYFDHWSNDIEQLSIKILSFVKEEGKTHEAFKMKFEQLKNKLRQDVDKNISDEQLYKMLVQNKITQPIFEHLFDRNILENNPLFLDMQQTTEMLNIDSFIHSSGFGLDGFYKSVQNKAKNISKYEDKQKFINTIYEDFLIKSDPKDADKKGIVYTPKEAVQCMIRLVDDILKQHFSLALIDENVHILDPFSGTGNFIVHILRFFKEQKASNEQITHKYKNTLHANEINLLPYYISGVNIESVYEEITADRATFNKMCMVDTFSTLESNFTGKKSYLIEHQRDDDNSSRIKKQKQSPITVIISNPPYFGGQKNENDNNKASKYEFLDQQIKEKYINISDNPGNKNSLYDSYIKAFRWATDRLKDSNGVVAFISNNGFLDSRAMDGFRDALTHDFAAIYVLNLKGNNRSSDWKKEGGKFFGSGSMCGTSITFLVKGGNKKGLFIYSVDDYLKREQKLSILDTFYQNGLNAVSFELVIPKNRKWIHFGDESYQDYISFGNKQSKEEKTQPENVIFHRYSQGITTNRDDWDYHFSKSELSKNISSMIDVYNDNRNRSHAPENKNKNIDALVESDLTKIKWDSSLKNSLKRKQEAIFKEKSIIESSYRPFSKQFLYFDDIFINTIGQNHHLFPSQEDANVVISISGQAANSFSALASDCVSNLHYMDTTQCFPFYWYEYDKETGTGSNKRENITDWMLLNVQKQVKDESITKWDIFHYIYGILHHTKYLERFKNNLKDEYPRIPFVKTINDFLKIKDIGKELMHMHIHYESCAIPDYIKIVNKKDSTDKTVSKMRLTKDKKGLIYNDSYFFENIPPECFQYTIKGRSALEWIIDQYQVKTRKDSKIVKDPNDYQDSDYVFNLVLRVIGLSKKTSQLINHVSDISIFD